MVKKCKLTLAMSPTCHSNNALFICWHEFFLDELLSTTFGPVRTTDNRQTDRQTDRLQTDRKRCIWAHCANCTGGLKNWGVFLLGGGLLLEKIPQNQTQFKVRVNLSHDLRHDLAYFEARCSIFWYMSHVSVNLKVLQILAVLSRS